MGYELYCLCLFYVLFPWPLLSGCEGYLWVHRIPGCYHVSDIPGYNTFYILFYCSCRWIYFCLVLWYNEIHGRIEKFFQLITFLCIFEIPHKYIKSKCNPQSTAKKCLDDHMLKIPCLSVLLNCGIGLEINVHRFGPLYLYFLKSKQESSDLWRVTCSSCCKLVLLLLSGVLFKKSASPGSWHAHIL